jgi:hypothetical protein
VYVIGRGWRCAKELERGDILASHNGAVGVVEEVAETGQVKTVYNLRVANWHTYFVGSPEWGFSVWAHNANYSWFVHEGVYYLRNAKGQVIRSPYQSHDALKLGMKDQTLRQINPPKGFKASDAFEDAGSAARASTWTRPPGLHLPKNGSWSGTPGNSDFIPTNPQALGLPAGTRIPFRNGYPDFSQWQRGNPLNVPGLNGVHGNDMPAIHREIARRNGWLNRDGTPNAAAAQRWLAQQRLTPHHAGGDVVQLIPRDLHEGVRHTGGAWELRNP